MVVASTLVHVNAEAEAASWWREAECFEAALVLAADLLEYWDGEALEPIVAASGVLMQLTEDPAGLRWLRAQVFEECGAWLRLHASAAAVLACLEVWAAMSEDVAQAAAIEAAREALSSAVRATVRAVSPMLVTVGCA